MSTDPHRPRRGGRGADLRAARPNPYYDFVCDDDVYLNDDCIYDDCSTTPPDYTAASAQHRRCAAPPPTLMTRGPRRRCSSRPTDPARHPPLGRGLGRDTCVPAATTLHRQRAHHSCREDGPERTRKKSAAVRAEQA